MRSRKHEELGWCRYGVGLRGVCRALLEKDLSKDPRVRCGNWAARPLSEEQIQYAACDAYVAVDILDAMFARASANVSSSANATPVPSSASTASLGAEVKAHGR